MWMSVEIHLQACACRRSGWYPCPDCLGSVQGWTSSFRECLIFYQPLHLSKAHSAQSFLGHTYFSFRLFGPDSKARSDCIAIKLNSRRHLACTRSKLHDATYSQPLFLSATDSSSSSRSSMRISSQNHSRMRSEFAWSFSASC